MVNWLVFGTVAGGVAALIEPCLAVPTGTARAPVIVTARLSSSEGREEGDPELEIEIEHRRDPPGWTAQVLDTEARVPGVESGVLMVTLLDGERAGQCADADVDFVGRRLVLRGRSAFRTP
jgi:hypothetical protein